MPGELKDSKPPTSHSPHGELTGVILAGGKSRRYGRNKALVQLDGMALIERVLTVMQSLFQQIVLITNTPEAYAYLNLPMHEDIIKDLGPLGGIYTALRSIRTEAGFVVACDMPLVGGELLDHLLAGRDRAAPATALVNPATGRLEPLLAIYEPSALRGLRHALDAQERSLTDWLEAVGARPLTAPRELAGQLANVNIPEELDAIRRRLDGKV